MVEWWNQGLVKKINYDMLEGGNEMKIDAHQHYWKLSRGDYDWISADNKTLYQNYLPQDLIENLQKNSISKTILVQAAPTIAETEFMLQLSEQEESIAGVVGWLDLEQSSYQQHLERFLKHPKFVGLRVMIQAMDKAEQVLQKEYIEALQYFAEIDLPVDLLVVSHQLPAVIQLLEYVPDLRGVIDHIAKPNIAEQQLEPWKEQMQQMAKHSKIYCKLSGMVTEADHQHWKREDFLPYVQHIVDIFGTERLMYGSDWPVCLLAASYNQVYDLLEYSLPKGLTEQERRDIFGNNAARFYKLDKLIVK